MPKAKVSRERRSLQTAISQENLDQVTFRDVEILNLFVSGQGKILPRRKTGISARSQRHIARAIKQAREMGLLAGRGQR